MKPFEPPKPKKADVDYDRVSTLMNIIEKAASVCPMDMAIAGAAAMELKEINEACLEVQRDNAKAVEEAKAEYDAELEHERKMEEDPEYVRPNVRPTPIYPADSGVQEQPGKPIVEDRRL